MIESTLLYRAAILLAVCSSLTGCAVAPVAMLVGTQGTFGYQLYNMFRDGKVKVELEKREPSANDASRIRSAESIAVWPFLGGAEGQLADIIEDRTGLKVTSPREVHAYTKKNSIPENSQGLRAQEKTSSALNIGRAVGSDLVLLVELIDQKASIGIINASTATNSYHVTLVGTNEQRILWRENARVIYEFNTNPPSNQEVARYGFEALAERINELRE